MASYIFYSCWDWRFLFLLVFSTCLDYVSGLGIEKYKNKKSKKMILWLSIGINLGFLGLFKYYNFFIDSIAQVLIQAGFETNFSTLSVILPVGISFYTFHGLSYVIDIYYERIKPERNFVSYSLFVSYFPLLVAGPIERATHLLPQIKQNRYFNHNLAILGVKQIIWGLFKKIVIADNCSFFSNQLFENPGSFSSIELWLGAILFAFQIYGDFSGYSDIALGVSKLFGIELLRNFNFPYFARDIADFWRRWHISLSSWFRDYVYIPLGGSRVSKILQIRNTFIIFLLSGFWHGANWTFIIWGAIHAMLFIPLLLFNKNKTNTHLIKYRMFDLPKVLFTFLCVCMAWVFFRAKTISDSFEYIVGMFNFSDFSIDFFTKTSKYLLLSGISLFSIIILLILEWNFVKRKYTEVNLGLRQSFFILTLIILMGAFKNQLSFIYFQF